MELRISGRPTTNDNVTEFDLVREGDDVVLVAYHPQGNKELSHTEMVRFKPDGRCVAAHRPNGHFFNRDHCGRFIISNVSHLGAL